MSMSSPTQFFFLGGDRPPCPPLDYARDLESIIVHLVMLSDVFLVLCD